MALRKQKLTRANLREGSKYIVASVVVEALLLAPKTTIKLGDKEYAVGGVFPMLQKEIATVVRDTLNTVVPKAAGSVDSVLRNFNLKNKVTDRVMWFVYDYMEQFTLNSVLTRVFERSALLENNKVTGVLRNYVNGMLENKNDRDQLLRSMTTGIMNAIGIMAEGTVLAGFFTDRVIESLTEVVTAAVERGLQTEFGANLAERLLDAIDHYETLTLSGFLESHLGMDRFAVEDWLNHTYEKYVGSEMVKHYMNLGLGDALYAKIAGMDYDAVFRDITQNHWKDLLGVTMGAASAGLTIMNFSHNLNAREEKRRGKKMKRVEKKVAKAEKKSAGKNAKARKKLEKAAAKSGVTLTIE